jgi:hypothetical protein
MFAIIYLLAAFIADLFKPPRRLEVENLFLRHQLNVALRRAPQRVQLRAGDRDGERVPGADVWSSKAMAEWSTSDPLGKPREIVFPSQEIRR